MPTKDFDLTNFNFQYAPGYILLCLAIAILFAIGLYFRDKKFLEHKKWLPYLLGVFRFLVISLLGLLLLVPMLKSIFEETKNPIIIIAEDRSGSTTSTGLEAQEKIISDINKIKTELEADFQVEDYYFSNDLYSEVPDSIDTKSTNLEKVFTNIEELYINQNVGAIVLVTDGIYNEGKNPLYLTNNISAPLYAVALGDTSQRKDLVLSRALNNKIVFLGDKFSVQIDINAINCAGESSVLRIHQINDDGTRRLVDSKNVRISSNDFFTTEEFVIDANQSGIVRYTASLTGVKDEISTRNNRKDIFVEVLDSRQNILLLANAPHPDISALKQIIEGNKNYEVTTSYIDNNDITNDQFDLVVLHNLPSGKQDITTILARPNLNRAARLFIFGSQTNHAKFNQLQNVINLEGNSNSLNDVQAITDDGFKLFNLSEALQLELPNYPPLLSPFGNYTISPNSTVLLKQRIGKVDTEYPLLVFNDQGGKKTGVLAAEGIWKWRLFNYLQKSHYDEITEVVNKSLQYLTLKEDKRKFRVNPSQNIFKENEPILINAELYNDSYEKINEPDVNIVVTNADRKNFDFIFSKRGDYYYLDAGQFPAGTYRFAATVNYNGKRLEQSGRFSVESIQLEAYDLTARHGLLRSLTEKYGGELIEASEINTITAKISENNQIKPVIYASSRTNKLMDQKWIFFLIFSFLGLEWFLRRYFGSY